MTNGITVSVFSTLSLPIPSLIIPFFYSSTNNACISHVLEAWFMCQLQLFLKDFFINIFKPFENIYEISNFRLAYFFIGQTLRIVSFLIWMKFVGFEVLTAVVMRNSVFWDKTEEYIASIF
jgi:hypothetical protein